MLKIFRYPFITRNEIEKKMLLYSLPVILSLLISMIPLFIFMAIDSEKNRDAIVKTSSRQTELSLLLVFVTFLISISIISFIGIRLSKKIRRNFEIWVSFKGVIYYMKAKVPRGTSISSPQHFNSVTKSQDRAINFLGSEEVIRELLTSGQTPKNVTILCAKEAKIIKKKHCSVICFENGRKIKLYKDIIDYDTLIDKIMKII